MKIEIVTGQVYSGNNPAAGPGDVIDLPDAEAQRLITLGVAKKPGAPEPPAKTEAEIAAKKRKKMEDAAVKAGLATADEVGKLSDEELFALVKDK
jgi:hypothetical protein